MDYVFPVIWAALWVLRQLALLIWWTWPITIISWPLTFITIVSAYFEYRKSGGGVWNALKAAGLAIVKLPQTALTTVRVLAGIVIMAIRASGKEDPSGHMPEWMRKLLGLGPTGPTRIVEKVVEKRVEVPVPGKIRFRHKMRIFLFAGTFWVPMTLVAVYILMR